MAERFGIDQAAGMGPEQGSTLPADLTSTDVLFDETTLHAILANAYRSQRRKGLSHHEAEELAAAVSALRHQARPVYGALGYTADSVPKSLEFSVAAPSAESVYIDEKTWYDRA